MAQAAGCGRQGEVVAGLREAMTMAGADGHGREAAAAPPLLAEYAGPLSVELFLPRFQDGNAYEVAREIRQKCEAIKGKAQVL